MTTTAIRAVQSMRELWRQLLADRMLLACGLIALVVLAPGAGWGIPAATSEVTVRGWEVDAVTGIGVLSELSNLMGRGRDDWYVAYPLFHYLVLAVAYLPYLGFSVLTGTLAAPGPAFPYGLQDPVRAFVVLNGIGHAITVIMGSVTVMATFALGRRLSGPRGGLLAAVLALCSAPFLFYARTGNLDVPALCWTMLALVAMERAWTDGLTRHRAIACGSLAALAVATKDQSYGLLVGPLLLLVFRSIRHPRDSSGTPFRSAVILLVSGFVVFLVAGGVVIRPDRFVRHLEYIASFRETFTNVRNPTELTVMRPPTVAGRLMLMEDLLRATGTAVGWPVVAAGLGGFVLLWRSTTTVRLLMAAFVGYFLLVLVPIEHMQYRYAVTPAILLALSAAGVAARYASRPRPFAVAALVLVAPALAGGAEVTHAMLTDARYAASAWLGGHAAPGDTLGFFGRPHQLPHVPVGVNALALNEGDGRDRLRAVRPRWIVVAPDYFANPSREHSIFLPDVLYDSLQSGALGWQRVARFESRGLLRRPLPYLPYVNPVVQIFERRSTN